jgi:hypothetical protein
MTTPLRSTLVQTLCRAGRLIFGNSRSRSALPYLDLGYLPRGFRTSAPRFWDCQSHLGTRPCVDHRGPGKPLRRHPSQNARALPLRARRFIRLAQIAASSNHVVGIMNFLRRTRAALRSPIGTSSRTVLVCWSCAFLHRVGCLVERRVNPAAIAGQANSRRSQPVSGGSAPCRRLPERAITAARDGEAIPLQCRRKRAQVASRLICLIWAAQIPVRAQVNA